MPNKAKEDISISKHILKIKVCCYLIYDTIYFDSCGVEHIPKDINKFTEDKKMKVNHFWP